MPMESDESTRPPDAMPPVTIDFKYMIHRIHYGEEQSTPFIIYGHGGSLVNFSDVLYPANIQDCSKCHVDSSYDLPLQPGVLSTTVKEAGAVVSVNPPTTSVCTSCHDTSAAAAHAELMTTSDGVESCAVCHGSGKDFDVATAHMMNVKASIQQVNLY
jgi:OmcA/MtrC family decaheme c-type cytochrome